MALYAAYGSNMDPAHMLQRCPSSPVAGTGWLPGWRLTFGGEDIGWDGALATVVQVCFLESMRLRPREYDTLRVFEESVESALDVPADTGALTFSLWKHTILALIAVPVYSIAQSPWEAAIYGFILMLGSAYLVPQFLYRRTKGRWLIRTLPLLRLMIKMAKPLISLLSGIRAVAEMAGEDESGEKDGQDEHEIEALIEAGAEEGLIEEGDKRLIKTVIEFGDKTVREVMTPRGNIVAISQDKTMEELRRTHESPGKRPEEIFPGMVSDEGTQGAQDPAPGG